MKKLDYNKMYLTPSLWLVNNELVIHYPGAYDFGKCVYFNNKTKKWSKSKLDKYSLYVNSNPLKTYEPTYFISWIE